MIPFEALLPYGIIVAMFTVTGVGVHSLNYVQNGWKPKRHNLDIWDRQMMARDERLTNQYRGQSDRPRAPQGFELSSRWKLEPRMY